VFQAGGDDGRLLAMSPGSGPLLVLGAGQRCGSTLLQRLLSSHPDVHIWGEHAGQLRPLLAVAARTKTWAATEGSWGRQEFAAGGYQSFMANVTPEPGWVDEATRRFIGTLFGEPALAMGRKVWGFKEVRYGLPEAQAIQRLFPGTRVIHVVRDPRDVLRSLDAWERNRIAWPRGKTRAAVNDWLRIATSFLSLDETDMPPVLRLRYEDIIRAPAATCQRIGEHTGLDPDLFDQEVFARKIHTSVSDRVDDRDIRAWNELPDLLRALLARDDLRQTAFACGYDLYDEGVSLKPNVYRDPGPALSGTSRQPYFSSDECHNPVTGLPAPLRPSRPVMVPAPTVRFTSSRAASSPGRNNPGRER
jgi:hypothetical protein